MNKIVRYISCFLLIALFCTLAVGCESDALTEDKNTYTTSTTTAASVADKNETEAPVPITLEFEATVSYANWSVDPLIKSLALNSELTENKKDRIPVYRFDTLEDLEGFKTDFGEILSMSAGYDEIPSFEEATAKYDEAFFEENSILLVYVTASSGSYRYQIVDIEITEGSLIVQAKKTNSPQIGTCDMAGWFLTVAIPDEKLADITVFDARLDNSSN